MKRKDISKQLTLHDFKISTVSELRETFEAVFNVPLQQRVSLDFVKGNLAWHIQAKQQQQQQNPKKRGPDHFVPVISCAMAVRLLYCVPCQR